MDLGQHVELVFFRIFYEGKKILKESIITFATPQNSKAEKLRKETKRKNVRRTRIV